MWLIMTICKFDHAYQQINQMQWVVCHCQLLLPGPNQFKQCWLLDKKNNTLLTNNSLFLMCELQFGKRGEQLLPLPSHRIPVQSHEKLSSSVESYCEHGDVFSPMYLGEEKHCSQI